MKRHGLEFLVILAFVVMVDCASTDTGQVDPSSHQTVEVVYFYTPSCSSCQKLIQYFENHEYRDLFSLEKISLEGDVENVSRLREYYEKYDVPRDRWSGLMAKDTYYGSFRAVYDNFDEDLKQYLENQRI